MRQREVWVTSSPTLISKSQLVRLKHLGMSGSVVGITPFQFELGPDEDWMPPYEFGDDTDPGKVWIKAQPSWATILVEVIES